MSGKQYYFTTRDLLIMAALASLGGIAGTYINALGDVFQSVLGFAGTTQWAAGLHVLWLILAAGLVKKPGTATITGILKGVVELLTGNTHGLLVLLVDVVAGVMVDLCLLPFGKKLNIWIYAFAGGLAAASNVFVFQLFASLPADMLAYGGLLLVGLVAFISGVIFAGILGWTLMNTLQQAGVIKQVQVHETPRRGVAIFLAGAVLITVLLAVFLRGALQGPETVSIGGAVQTPYDFPQEHGDIEEIVAEGTLRGATTRYKGFSVKEIVDSAGPISDQGWILIQGSDGYSFFITMDELNGNESLLLSPQSEGGGNSYNLVGANNSKAWVRGVQAILFISPPEIDITGMIDNPGVFDPNEWQFDMDSTTLTIDEITGKYQGAAIGPILSSMGLQAEAREVVLVGDQNSISLELSSILNDQDIRIFTIIIGENVSYAVARMDGQLILSDLQQIEIR
ncbi:MAG TPA: ECF transporter S component [Anaerolineales bacterium]|nr:ECF transporter S component [Anaerolineales bacterium]